MAVNRGGRLGQARFIFTGFCTVSLRIPGGSVVVVLAWSIHFVWVQRNSYWQIYPL